ncbi:MAG: hypothetical protein MHM6MM_008495 [Cercozoa sp. M6MM]
MAVERELWGGAFAARIFGEFVDISNYRQVPDHQEVYAHADTDRSIIFEVVEMMDESDSRLAMQRHWEELCKANESPDHECAIRQLTQEEVPNFPHSHQDDGCWVARGTQHISKGRDSADAANTVRVSLALIRLPHVTTDLLVQSNVPTRISTASQARAASPIHDEEAKTSDSNTSDDNSSSDVVPLEDFLAEALSSLQCRDWTLFGPDAAAP